MKMTIDNLHQIIIGREDDGGVSLVEIDCTSWKTKHPQLTDYRLEVTSPGGVVYFPDVKMDGDMLVWEIRQSDTAVKGTGRYQVVAVGGEGEKKTSDNARVVVMAVMPGTASDAPPEPSKPWTDQVYDAAKKVEETAKRIEEMGGVSDKQIAGAVESYFDKNPGAGGASIDDETASEKTTYSGKKIEAELSKLNEAIDEKVDAKQLNTAVEDALEQAKESGEFDGPEGKQGPAGDPGKDYMLTEEDKREIAGMVDVSGGSEDVFDLIETFVVTDATVQNYDFNTEPDGTPYAFQRMMIVVNAEQGDADGTVSFAYGSLSLCYAAKAVVATGAITTTCLIDTIILNEAGQQKRVILARCNLQGYGSDTSQFTWQTRGYGNPPRLAIPVTGIDKIRIQAKLPIDSTIRIYGVR